MSQDYNFMSLALQQASLCLHSSTRYSVGCVLTTLDDFDISNIPTVVSTGYSDETINCHAEHSALLKLQSYTLQQLCLYSTMEPCSVRKSGRLSCCYYITHSHQLFGVNIKRVVFGCKEPNLFVTCDGMQMLVDAGIDVVWLKDMEEQCIHSCGHVC